MTISKLPVKLQKIVTVMVFLSAVSLLAISSNAPQHGDESQKTVASIIAGENDTQVNDNVAVLN